MRQLTLEEIRNQIAVTLAVTPKHVLAKLTHKLPAEADAGRAEVAARLADRFHGDCTRVVRTDLVQRSDCSSTPGKFGIDEPEP